MSLERNYSKRDMICLPNVIFWERFLSFHGSRFLIFIPSQKSLPVKNIVQGRPPKCNWRFKAMFWWQAASVRENILVRKAMKTFHYSERLIPWRNNRFVNDRRKCCFFESIQEWKHAKKKTQKHQITIRFSKKWLMSIHCFWVWVNSDVIFHVS